MVCQVKVKVVCFEEETSTSITCCSFLCSTSLFLQLRTGRVGCLPLEEHWGTNHAESSKLKEKLVSLLNGKAVNTLPSECSLSTKMIFDAYKN